MKKPAYVIWLTGISGAGKTTLGKGLVQYLVEQSIPCEFLDGDRVRNFFGNDLGYSRQERIQNVKRIAFAAKLLSDHGITVVVSNIAPYREVRDFIRANTRNYFQIYVKASLDTVQKRDVRKLYRDFKAGKCCSVVGMDDSYDEPRNPDLIVETDNASIEQSLENIINQLKGHQILP